jgi:hypothetical protein
MSEMKTQAEHLAGIAESDGTAAQELLARWESETKSALRIDDVP